MLVIENIRKCAKKIFKKQHGVRKRRAGQLCSETYSRKYICPNETKSDVRTKEMCGFDF